MPLPRPSDTAATLHYLLERKRELWRRMMLSTAGTGGLLAGSGVLDAGNQHDGLAQELDYEFAIPFGFVAGIVVLVLLAAFDRYSRLHERRALNLSGYHSLPANLARELELQDVEAPPLPWGWGRAMLPCATQRHLLC